MNTTTRLRRRHLPGCLALALAAGRAGGDAWGQAAASAPPGGDGSPKPKPPKDGEKDPDRGKDKPAARLVIKVSGDGKPVAHADVKVKIGGGDGIPLVTNDRGEASLTRNGGGLAEVHVIAQGWASGRGVVELKAGEVTLSIELKKPE